ncbi:FKBP-type peptidyl-prolyl cis-trans isomerase [Schaalia suimastitidis]|uniref:FKBP-type peptidyl-prolyl cis-trans isomerase n=1 Tax=Schaalia suimastitidis TaxID=121163 RepID=UPI0003F8AA98|nr:FKBP-type peptidyl-prolyl cis-trans isomerase [Schaalia suimastitidis]
MKKTTQLAALIATVAIAGGSILAACTPSNDTADTAATTTTTTDTATQTPEVDRSGEGNFPEATGTFGEDPTISAGSGQEPTKIIVKTIHQGNGEVVTTDDTLTVNYEGALWDGTVFDSSFDRGAPATFSLNGVIEGWKYGLAEQRVGDRVMIVIPSQWGYGEAGAGENIPPNATLVFVVDILAAVNPNDISALTQATPTGNTVAGVEVSGELATEPTIAFTGDAPTENQTVVLAEGAGEAIVAGQSVLTHGVGVAYGVDQLDSTWSALPVEIAADVYGLTGIKVGSRVLVIKVPTEEERTTQEQAGVQVAPAYAFVLDIVAALPVQ